MGQEQDQAQGQGQVVKELAQDLARGQNLVKELAQDLARGQNLVKATGQVQEDLILPLGQN